MNKHQLKKIIKCFLMEDAIIEAGTTKCSVCGAPVSAKDLAEKAENAKCPYCKNPYNWQLYIKKYTKSGDVEATTSISLSGKSPNLASKSGAFGGVLPAGSSDKSATGTTSSETPKNVKINKFAELLQEKIGNEESLGTTNALGFLFKQQKYGNLYDSILNGTFKKEEEENISSTIDMFIDYAKKVLDNVGANPANFPRGIEALNTAIQGKYFETSDWYKQNVKSDLIKPFFRNPKSISALADLLTNRDKYLNGLNNLGYSGLKISTFAESISKNFGKKLTSIYRP